VLLADGKGSRRGKVGGIGLQVKKSRRGEKGDLPSRGKYRISIWRERKLTPTGRKVLLSPGGKVTGILKRKESRAGGK